nr:MBL fold metallo-hydrolase [Saprospiraceae bacterium]
MRFEFTVLGSNAAVPAYGRNPSAHMLNIYEKIYLLDCGEGTQMQLNLFNFNKNKIQVIFITHLHGDHCFGLPGLLTSMSLNKRVTELVIFSPPGLQQMIAAMLHYSQTEPSFVIRYEEVDTEQHQKIYENEQVEVFSIPLEHRISTTGYLFLEKQRKQKIRKEALEKYNLPTQILNDVKQGANFTTEN